MAELWKLWDVVCNFNCYVFVFVFVSFGINLENYHLTRANLSKLGDVVEKREQNDGKNVHPATKQLEMFFYFVTKITHFLKTDAFEETIATWGWISDGQNCDLIFDKLAGLKVKENFFVAGIDLISDDLKSLLFEGSLWLQVDASLIIVIFVTLLHYLGSCKKYANKCVTSQQYTQKGQIFAFSVL